MIQSIARHIRNRAFGLIFLLQLVLLGTAVRAQLLRSEAPQLSMRVFVIGNSFSGNATKYLPEIVSSCQKAIELGKAQLPGCTMKRHWEGVLANEKDSLDPEGRPYNGRSLKAMLSEGSWDVVTIQQFSLHSGDVETYRPYADLLCRFIRTLQPNARVLLHQTWAYRSDSKDFCLIGKGEEAKDQQQMWQFSRNAYHTIAGESGIGLIPVGDVFYAVDNDPENGYRKDAAIDPAQLKYPSLPQQKHSLHAGYSWDKDKKLIFDSHHASDAGCYLAGLLWYAIIFNAGIGEVKYKPATVSQDFAEYLKKKAEAVVLEEQIQNDNPGPKAL